MNGLESMVRIRTDGIRRRGSRALLDYGRATSQRETVYGLPAGPPTMKIAVPSAVARAWRSNVGSRTKTTVPAGASIS